MGIMEKPRYGFRYFHGSLLVLVLQASRMNGMIPRKPTGNYCGQPRMGDAISIAFVPSVIFSESPVSSVSCKILARTFARSFPVVLDDCMRIGVRISIGLEGSTKRTKRMGKTK